MAANSPVVINSSSPPPLRLPSETPPRASAAGSSSSSGLPSPSTFFRRPAAAPKSKFQTASSLFKSDYFANEQQPQETSNDRVSGRRNEPTRPVTAADGVAKAKEPAGATLARERLGAKAKNTIHNGAYLERPTERLASRSPVRHDLLVSVGAETRPETKSRTPSISLSVYSFDGGFEQDVRPPPAPQRAPARPVEIVYGTDDSLGKSRRPRDTTVSEDDFRPGQQSATETAVASLKPAKKPRKRVANAAADAGDEVPKQTKRRAPKSKTGDQPKEKTARKPVAKSASFVLNSDDLASTQFAGMDAAQVQGSKPPDLGTSRHDSAPVEKRKRAPRKNKKVEDGVFMLDTREPGVHSNADKASASFSQPAVPGDDSAIDLSIAVDVQVEPETTSATPVHAHQRRRSWTPARNTTLQRNLANSAALSEDDEPPALSLAAVLGNLAYNKQDVAVPHRAASGEGPLKRRRIELADEATAAPKVKKKSEADKVVPCEKVKKPKAVKKKPQTITELATKAYRSEDVPPAAQATVSSFFAAHSTGADGPPPLISADDTSSKSAKPRKPREKKANEEAKTDKPKQAAKAKAKPKPKMRVNNDDLFGELYAPEQARLQEGRQDFLFGTSSQLGAEGSPTFVRQMQLAVRESEIASTARCSSTPTRKSCVGVPTAPHGTSLSCGQAIRGLWCSAARDDRNDVLATEHLAPLRDAVSHPQPEVVLAESRATVQRASFTVSEQRGTSVLPKPHDSLDPIPGTRDDRLPSQSLRDIVDLCHTSPIVQQRQDTVAVMDRSRDDLTGDPPPPNADDLPVHTTQSPSSNLEPRSDDWAILEDSSPEVPLNMRRSPQGRAMKPLPQLKRCATSPVRDRSALRALDANVSPHMRNSPHKSLPATRHASSSVAQFQSKQRGDSAQEASAMSDKVTMSPKRRGRPPKHSKISPSKLFSASQPVTSSDFINIDEVSDDEPAITPPPPRRRATSTPSPIRPLEFEIVVSPSVKARSKSKKSESKDTVTPAAACSKLKPDDAIWISAMPTLFPQITATIKSTAPSTDLSKPTWYEKILLYDPIVLEDLTTWLNERGVRVETKRLKAKPKVKVRRKKKDVQELETAEEMVVPDEYETLQELLKPWMVQKWCEDKSVCCLWKEGLRGGVRTRY